MANRNSGSVGHKFSQNINKCQICYEPFNRYEKQPLIICANHHTICRQCLKGIRGKQMCPYCRLTIVSGKAVCNNYIFELLPSDPEGEKRMALKQQEQMQKNRLHLNRSEERQQERSEGSGIHLDHEEDIVADMPLLMPPRQPRFCSCEGIKQRLGFDDDGDHALRKALYIIIFVLQVPFLICDLVLAITSETSECMDQAHEEGIYVLRPWLLAMGITEASFIGLLTLFILVRLIGLINVKVLQAAQICIGFLFLIKTIGWCYIQLNLFIYDIKDNCNGGIFAYGIVLTVLHAILAVIMACLKACG